MKITTALNVAYFFIEVSSHEDEPDLTNLKLQKLLYFAQGKHLAKYNEPLFSDEIEAWSYGPVVKDVYHALKHCGAFPITIFDVKGESDIPSSESGFLMEIWSDYAKYSAGHLVQETHAKDGPWENNYTKGVNSIIPKDELKTFFAV